MKAIDLYVLKCMKRRVVTIVELGTCVSGATAQDIADDLLYRWDKCVVECDDLTAVLTDLSLTADEMPAFGTCKAADVLHLLRTARQANEIIRDLIGNYNA